jgi:hypothetical protein
VWIDVGRKLPRYLANNIKLHSELYPRVSQFLVADKELKAQLTLQVKSVPLSHIRKSDLTTTFEAIEEEREQKFKQANFWSLTTKRFFYLYDFMIENRLERVLHVESDTVILDLENLVTVMNSGMGLSFPMQSDVLGCASVFYVDNIDLLKRFNSFILERWQNPDVNDMTLLGDFGHQIGIKLLNSKLINPAIIDPGIYGPYFLGGDARNYRWPFSRRGHIKETFPEIYEKLPKTKLRVGANSDEVYLDYRQDGIESHLLNIHIHSKQIPRSKSVLLRKLRQASRSDRFLWRLGHLDLLVLFERIASKFSSFRGSRVDVRFR